MPSFTKGGGVTTPFGKNEFLRSTRGVKTESYTFAAATLPAVTIDANPGQKVLQPGVVLAKITSGVDAGKVGPYQPAVADGRQTVANIVGINRTFLPWQLIERDVEVAAVYECTAVQGWCLEMNAAGAFIVLTDATAAEMVAKKGLSMSFK